MKAAKTESTAKKNNDKNLINDLNLEMEIDLNLDLNLPKVYPYAVMYVSNFSLSNAKKVSTFFDLEFESLPDSETHTFSTKEKKDGEHKIQTLILFAAAATINAKLVNTKIKLQIENELLKQATFKSDPISETKQLPNGTLELSSGCQLFLFQAGLPLRTTENQRVLSKSEVQKLAEGFMDSMLRFSTARSA